MTDKDFWEIISNSQSVLKHGETDGNLESQASELAKILDRLNKQEFKAFSRQFGDKLEGAYTWGLWGAALIINGGLCTDSMFSFFRNWVISLGEDAYLLAIDDPDSLIKAIEKPTYEDVNFEEFDLVVEEAYENRFAEDDSDLDLNDFLDREPKGAKWSSESVYALFPRLSEKYL